MTLEEFNELFKGYCLKENSSEFLLFLFIVFNIVLIALDEELLWLLKLLLVSSLNELNIVYFIIISIMIKIRILAIGSYYIINYIIIIRKMRLWDIYIIIWVNSYGIIIVILEIVWIIRWVLDYSSFIIHYKLCIL